ncbi:MAG: phosphatidate cytidylyltransferase [Clostridiales bacterium]|nr:phosphatidate cytidylyltransferase [Clostridiales bacterium]
MKQRIITALLLVTLLSVLMYFGGAVLSVAAFICICFAVYEEYHALALKGHRPVALPTWISMALSIPLMLILDSSIIIPILIAVCFATGVVVMFREEPKLEDILVSVMPLITIVLPGMCLIALALAQPKALSVVLLSMMFVIPVLGDTLAFLVGSRVGGPKLCPAVSPNKTISGAIAGLAGSLLGSLLVGLIAWYCCDEATRAQLPTLLAYISLGLLGGAVGQVGDLFASLIKRHCGIKDFSNLFPGHGGMLDRMDSVLFVALVIFSYYIFI